ncbi:HRDC-like protein [Cristinia sonorae]|uniref:DNA-directed RNA polymerase III subunit RPC9 n=1 Tax=Cristinia sonorae TaxID=1940300 RepID=A0A8K0XL67_9AGAR|nr:HRDC-like protein [Cristinia sonorae]
MEVINQRAALLCNYEVLTLLRTMKADHTAKTRSALRIKKEEEAAGLPSARQNMAPEESLDNLRTVEVEAIQYLSADYQPTVVQTETGITQLTKALGAYELTKAEKLQIVNLAPTEPVELYVIVEELEDRLGDKMDEILTTVRDSLTAPIPDPLAGDVTNTGSGALMEVYDEQGAAEVYDEGDAGWEYDQEVFDDTGEGAGVEGDLDKEDDE